MEKKVKPIKASKPKKKRTLKGQENITYSTTYLQWLFALTPS